MKSDLTLVIGNRNFSSWSLRAWLALTWTGAPFEEVRIWFDQDVDRSERRRHAPTGRVPVLVAGALTIWDSLAIAEYLAERFPEARLWPDARDERARARSLVCEMHSGFAALRRELPLNCRARKPARDRHPDVQRDIDRMLALWTETRAEYGAGGPFLFGKRTLADAFFAPVAVRFRTYAVPTSGCAEDYAEALLDLPALRRWLELAATEGHEVTEFGNADG